MEILTIYQYSNIELAFRAENILMSKSNLIYIIKILNCLLTFVMTQLLVKYNNNLVCRINYIYTAVEEKI